MNSWFKHSLLWPSTLTYVAQVMDCYRWFLQFLWPFWTALVRISISMICKRKKENKTRSWPKEREGDLIWCSSWKQEPGQFGKLHHIWVSVLGCWFEEQVSFQNKPYIFKANTLCDCTDHHRYLWLHHLHLCVCYKQPWKQETELHSLPGSERTWIQIWLKKPCPEEQHRGNRKTWSVFLSQKWIFALYPGNCS